MKRSKSCFNALLLLLLLVFMVASAAAVAAQGSTPAPGKETQPQIGPGVDQTLVITGEDSKTQVRLAFPAAEIDRGLRGEALEAAREIEQTLRDDLDQTAVFNSQGPTELAVLTLTGDRAQDFEQYRSLGNGVVLLATIKQEGDKLVLDGWVWDLPSKQSILGKRFRGTLSQARLVAHYLADAMHYQFTGRPSLALTNIS